MVGKSVLVAGLFGMLSVAKGEELVWVAPAPLPGGTSSGPAFTSNPENWSPARSPADGDVLVFSDAAGLARSVIHDISEVHLDGLAFQSSFSFSQTSLPISARSWTFSQWGYISIGPVFEAERADSAISTTRPETMVRLYPGMRFGRGHRTVTISGPGLVHIDRLSGSSKKGGIVMNGTGRLQITETSAGAPPIAINAGRLETRAKRWDRSHEIRIGPGGTLVGLGNVGTVISSGKVAPSYSFDEYGRPGTGMITITGEYSSPQGASASVSLEFTASGSNDRLISEGICDFRGTALNLIFQAGFKLAMGKSLTLVEVPAGGTIIGPFKNAPEGAKFGHAGGAYEVSYLGGPSGKDVILTRVPLPMPSLAATRAQRTPTMILTVAGLPGTTVQVESSADLKTWLPDAQYQMGTKGILTATRPIAPDTAAKFYRARGVEVE